MTLETTQVQWRIQRGFGGLLVLSENKLYHFHGIYKKNDIKSRRRTPNAFIHMNPLSRNPGSALEVSKTMKYNNHGVGKLMD